jgi:hypothetical protein
VKTAAVVLMALVAAWTLWAWVSSLLDERKRHALASLCFYAWSEPRLRGVIVKFCHRAVCSSLAPGYGR